MSSCTHGELQMFKVFMTDTGLSKAIYPQRARIEDDCRRESCSAKRKRSYSGKFQGGERRCKYKVL